MKTCRRWRKQAADDFTFTLKAWQALTHPISSPTWRGNEADITKERRGEVGYLRPNPVVKEAWSETFERASALEAPVLVLQCPPSFDPTDENETNMRKLIASLDRNGVELAWEPRGDWLEQPDRVARLCEDLGLVHSVDLMRRRPFYVGETAYVRLHGLNEDPYDYDYEYSREELEDLNGRLEELNSSCDEVYCLFNNFEKFENAETLTGMF